MAKRKYKKEHRFRTRWYHRKFAYWLSKVPSRQPGHRQVPEVIRLDAEPGVTPSDKPPVRIFLGTEPAQYRAERVFIWSIVQVRDPARVYEIYIMKDLVGFDRTRWKTGFTNYRYAIPALAGGKGRAIFNDVDQIYLSDPAELFDMDMGSAGILGITARENSVMLIDCARMIDYWTLEDAQTGKRHRHFRDVAHDNRLWGILPGEWNARDDEYRAGKSKCFHYTTLQTQPWRPLRNRLRYKPHPDGEVWFALERAADKAHFTAFTKEAPSRHFQAMLDQYRIVHHRSKKQLGAGAQEVMNGQTAAKHGDQIADLVKATGARTVLDYGSGKGGSYEPVPGAAEDSPFKTCSAWPDVKVTCYDPRYAPYAAYHGTSDGVVSTDMLEHVPEEDVGWVLDEIFEAADRFVYLVADCYPARRTLPNGANAHCTLQSPEWWCGQVELASHRCPGVPWTLCTVERTPFGKKRHYFSGEGALAKAA